MRMVQTGLLRCDTGTMGPITSQTCHRSTLGQKAPRRPGTSTQQYDTYAATNQQELASR